MAITGDYDLDAAEMVVLREMVRVCDRLDDLDAAVRANGAVGSDGRVAPALVEARQQQLTLAKLATALRIPTDQPGASVSDAARAIASARWERGRRGA
jgi:hypothetical protein